MNQSTSFGMTGPLSLGKMLSHLKTSYVIQRLNQSGFMREREDPVLSTAQEVMKEGIMIMNETVIHHLVYGLSALAGFMLICNNYDLIILLLQITYKGCMSCLGYQRGKSVLVIKRTSKVQWRDPVASDAARGGIRLRQEKERAPPKVTFQSYCDIDIKPPIDEKNSDGSMTSRIGSETSKESESLPPTNSLEMIGQTQHQGFRIENEHGRLSPVDEKSETDALLPEEPIYSIVDGKQVIVEVHQAERVAEAQRLQQPVDHLPEITVTPPPPEDAAVSLNSQSEQAKFTKGT